MTKHQCQYFSNMYILESRQSSRIFLLLKRLESKLTRSSWPARNECETWIGYDRERNVGRRAGGNEAAGDTFNESALESDHGVRPNLRVDCIQTKRCSKYVGHCNKSQSVKRS
jgi:hypothetical protein